MEWKRIPQYPLYFISEYGDLFYIGSGMINVPSVTKKGYYKVKCMCKDNKTNNTHRVHRLVLQAFDPNPNYKHLEVNHLDLDKSNNHVSNLEWCTRKENRAHYEASRS